MHSIVVVVVVVILVVSVVVVVIVMLRQLRSFSLLQNDGQIRTHVAKLANVSFVFIVLTIFISLMFSTAADYRFIPC